ncbi:STAS domain-containing protein [Actinomadura flavalba]|uniref:STAS domain-containing protein n=1 Tax=Actinomadura flavalba TaxID=1120938 RepID=UPI0003761FFC|nr:STAS domain-containing protein [Actinomadura flavalba]
MSQARDTQEHLSIVVVHDDDERVRVKLDGILDHHTAAELARRVEEAAAPSARVILDLEGIAFCDSLGLNTVITLWKRARAGGGELVLTRPPALMRDLLSSTGLDTHITIEPS